MSQSVFAVDYGCYSDKGTDSIWSTRAAAEARIEAMKAERHYGSENAHVVEWYLNNVPPDTRPLWYVRFDRDGTIYCEAHLEAIRGPLSSAVWVKHDHRYQTFGNGILYVYAKTADLAVKIATDRRAETLAQVHSPEVEWAEVKP